MTQDADESGSGVDEVELQEIRDDISAVVARLDRLIAAGKDAEMEGVGKD